MSGKVACTSDLSTMGYWEGTALSKLQRILLALSPKVTDAYQPYIYIIKLSIAVILPTAKICFKPAVSTYVEKHLTVFLKKWKYNLCTIKLTNYKCTVTNKFNSKFIELCSHHNSVWEHFHHPQIYFVLFCSQFPLSPKPQTNSDLFSLPTDFLFPTFCINGIMQYIINCFWLLALRIVFWGTPILWDISIVGSFLWPNCSVVWIWHIVFINSAIYEY